MPKSLNVSRWVSALLPARLCRLVFAGVIGGSALVALLLLLTTLAPGVQAAPPARPLAEIITDTVKVTHTTSTTHEMSVFGNGKISDRFLNDNGRDQIDEAGNDPDATTIAVMFDQHASTTNPVDVGAQGEFTPTTPITLNTASDIPGYSEDSYAVYASGVLSYQITQRTLATDTNNCVIMELVIRNTGSVTTLTGGKLLYMVDIDVARRSRNDRGFYDPARRLVYLTDYEPSEAPFAGFAMGISLLEGDWRGYGIVLVTDPKYPDPSLGDSRIRDELITPTNAITDGGGTNQNLVAWLVADIPTLSPDEATTLAFGMCARNGGTESEATVNLIDTFDQQANLSVSKTATPTAGSSAIAGEPITYSIAISSTGDRYVDNIVVTDTVPAATDLITYSVSQGSITASGRLITATIGRLYPTSGTVTVTLVAAPSVTSTSGTVISNQAFINSEPIITSTNIITHQIINNPVLTLTKQVTSGNVVGAPFTYTITITNTGQGAVSNAVVTDVVPSEADYITGGTFISSADTVSWTIPTILYNESKQVTFVVTTCQMSVTNTLYRVVTSAQGVASPPGPVLLALLTTPTVEAGFDYSPLTITVNSAAYFTSTDTTNGGPVSTWTWDFGDGNMGSGSSTNHTYPNAGTYTVTLAVTDTCGYSDVATGTVLVHTPVLTVTKIANFPWWNFGYQYRQPITVSASSAAVPSDYTASMTFDHAALVSAGKSLTSGDDIRILHRDGATWTELDRALDPLSSWNTATTQIWFPLVDPIAASSADNSYYLYYGNGSAAAPPGDWEVVFMMGDDFDDGVLTSGIVTSTAGTATITETGGEAFIDLGTADADAGIIVMTNPLPDDKRFAIRHKAKLVSGGTVAFSNPEVKLIGIVEWPSQPTVITNTLENARRRIIDFQRVDGEAWIFHFDTYTNQVYWDGTAWGTGTNRSWGTLITDTYYIYDLISDGTNWHVKVSDASGTPITTTTPVTWANVLDNGDPFWLYWGEVYTNAYWADVKSDWVYVRKYVTPEPTAALGSEEDAIALGDPVIVGAPFTYTITVTNTGLGGATNVVVTDTLPVEANYISSDGWLVSSDSVSWTIPTILYNESKQVTFVVTTCQMSVTNILYRVVTSAQGVASPPGPVLLTLLAPPTLEAQFSYSPPSITVGSAVYFTSTSTTNGGPIVNWTWDFGDGGTGSGQTATHIYSNPGTYTVTLIVTDTCNYTDTVAETVQVYSPALTVTKSSTHPAPLSPGDIITYTIVVGNSGDVNATGAVISDTLPANTNFVTGSISLDPPGAGTKGTEPPILVSSLTITVGQRVTVTFAVTVSKPLTVGTMITNAASVTSTGTLTPSIDTVTDTVNGADLSISKISNPKPALPGKVITYTIMVTNPGMSSVTEATVSDTFSTDINNVSWTCSSSGGATCTASGSGDISDTITLPAFGVITYTVTGTLPALVTNTLINTATVTAPLGVTDPITANNTATDANPPSLQADLAISKSDEPDPVGASTTLTYTLSVSNVGPSTASAITVTDTLPPGVTYGNASGFGWNCDHNSGIVTCTMSSLAIGVAPDVIITVTTPVTGGIIVNTASLTATTPDPDVTNNVTTTDTLVTALVDLELTKVVTPSTVVPGQMLTYTLTYINHGPGAATNVLITDIESITVSIILTNVSYVYSGAEITLVGSISYTFQVADLAPGTGGIVTVTGVISPDLASDTSFTNTATITASISATTVDTDTTNNSDVVTMTVILPRVSFSSDNYSADEGAGPAIITVTLDTLPFVTVTVNYTTADGTAAAGDDYVAGSGTLAFIPGTTTLTFTVPITNDLQNENNETVLLALSAPTGAILDMPVTATLTISDNDTAGVSISPTTVAVSESGVTDTYQVVLTSQPTATVTITFNTDAQLSAISPITFTTLNWNSPQTVTVSAVNDSVVEGAHTSTITHTAASSDSNYDATSIDDVTVNISDNDSAGVTVNPTSVNVTEGGTSDTYQVVLNSEPTATVTITFGTDAQVDPIASLTFTALTWDSVQTVTVSAVDDGVVEGSPHLSTISHTATSSDSKYNGIAIAEVTVNITDNDAEADLWITKSGSPGTVKVDETLTYTLTITNDGPADAEGVIITDTLPVSVTYGGLVGVTPSLSGPTQTGRLLTWYTPTLPAGTLSTIIFTVTVDAEDSTTLTNSVVITSTTPDPVPGNNEADAPTQVEAQAVLVIAKTAVDLNGALLYPDDEVEYQVIVTNTHATYAQSNVAISDPVPASTALVAGSVTCSPGAICGESAGLVTATTGSLGPGEVLTLTFRVTVDPDTGGNTITNQARVASDQQPVPLQTPPVTDVVTTLMPALTLSKWADPDASQWSDTWTQYHFQITNTGDVPLTAIQIWDDQLSPSVGPFDVPDLAVGEGYIVTRWWPIYGDTYNVATATAQAPGFPHLVYATDDAYFDVVEGLSLALDVSVQPEVIPAGRMVTYTYRLTNVSNDWMEGGIITDTLYGDIASGLSLAPGESYTRIFMRSVSATAVNVAYAWGTDRLGTPVTATDRAKVTVGTQPMHSIYLPLVAKAAGGVQMQSIYLPVVMKNH